jgi:hypothetical protein
MNTSAPRIEEATFYSKEQDAHGAPVRTYRVLRTCYGDLRRWHYKISIAVLEKQAAEDVLGRTMLDIENPSSLWDDIWDSLPPRP